MPNFSASVAILLPKTENDERLTIRYRGLMNALQDLSVGSFITKSHTSYDHELQHFKNVFDVDHQSLGRTGTAIVVRDLTMAVKNKPLYDIANGLILAHHPDTNRFLANKERVFLKLVGVHPKTIVVTADELAEAVGNIPGKRLVIKPITGLRSKGVKVLTRRCMVLEVLGPGRYLLQEFIDTSAGIPEIGVKGVHNIRAISVGGKLIGSIARVGGTARNMLKQDVYGTFIDNQNLPAPMHKIIDAVHKVLKLKPGDGQNIVAIDMMRGIDGVGQQVDVLCEVNRRPARIGPYNLLKKENLDETGLLHLGKLWDHAEARLLAGAVR